MRALFSPSWLQRAARLSPEARNVAVAIWYLATVSRDRIIALNPATPSPVRLCPDGLNKGLDDLQAAHLVSALRLSTGLIRVEVRSRARGGA
jgi:hypothetical protein